MVTSRGGAPPGPGRARATTTVAFLQSVPERRANSRHSYDSLISVRANGSPARRSTCTASPGTEDHWVPLAASADIVRPSGDRTKNDIRSGGDGSPSAAAPSSSWRSCSVVSLGLAGCFAWSITLTSSLRVEVSEVSRRSARCSGVCWVLSTHEIDSGQALTSRPIILAALLSATLTMASTSVVLPCWSLVKNTSGGNCWPSSPAEAK
mmetsp:Transcript_36670/g.98260  ORF Transcript_36670/g.98260 Transcript_36670/m.98260 type:complete len:208 (-) Transcript_36670:704-1327(-)